MLHDWNSQLKTETEPTCVRYLSIIVIQNVSEKIIDIDIVPMKLNRFYFFYDRHSPSDAVSMGSAGSGSWGSSSYSDLEGSVYMQLKDDEISSIRPMSTLSNFEDEDPDGQ